MLKSRAVTFTLKRRFSLVHIALIVLLVNLVWLAGSALETRKFTSPTRQALKEVYGPGTNSEHEEEWIIRDYFHGLRDGVFVDVGANHYQRYSNTYYLETVMGWSGVAVEPQREFEAGYTTHRPRTRFLPFFVSDRSDEQATLYVLEHNKLVTSADRSFTERFGIGAHQITAPTITLNDLLATEEVGHFDFLSIDVELHEPQVLAGFDLRRFRPALVCIEAHSEVRQAILDYFTQSGYVIVAKYLRADTHNLYFKPMR